MASDEIIRISQLDPLNVEVVLPVAIHGLIYREMTAEVRPEAPFDEVRSAKVVIVDRVIDAASGTFGVRLELSNSDLRLPAGLKCSVEFNGSETVARKTAN